MTRHNEVPDYGTFEFSKKKNPYCLIIPIINEGEKFKNQLSRIKEYMSIVDIVVADGGSTDGSTTHAFLKKNGVTALLVKKGPGKLGAQYRMAYDYMLGKKYKGAIHIDGNGKDDPKSIPEFLRKLRTGYDYIQGSRFIPEGHGINTPFEREFAIKYIFSPLLSLSAGKTYTDTSNGFRAYSQKLINDPSLDLLRNIFSSYEILFYVTARANRLGLRSIEIPVTRSYPGHGETPTKIVGWKKKFDVLLMAVKASIGVYNY